MTLNFAGSISGGTNVLDVKTLQYFDSRYINTDEKIPKLDALIRRLKNVERTTHQHQINIDDFRVKFKIQEDKIRELERRNVNEKITALENDLRLEKQKIKIIEENYDTERRKLSRLKETVDARVSRMTMLDLENILERMSAVERAVTAKSAEFDDKVSKLVLLYNNFRRLNQHEIEVIRQAIRGILRELTDKAERPFYVKILQDIAGKLEPSAPPTTK